MTTATVPSKGRKPLLLVVGAVAVLALGAGGTFLLLGGSAEADVAEAPPVEGAVVPVAEMTANLAGPQIHFAKIAFSAILEEKADAAAVGERFPLLRDAAITELSTFDADRLRTTAGMDELRSRLTARAGELYPDGEVLRIILTELVVQ